MPDRNSVGSLDGDILILAHHAASIWRPEVADEIDRLEDFCRREMVRILTEQHGLDARKISASADKVCQRLRAAITDSIEARREVIAEQRSAARK